MNILQAKNNGAYIFIETDSRKNFKRYSIVRDISDTEKEVYCELNRSAYLTAKNKMGFTVKERETCFLNSIPFAHTNKDKVPMMEYYNK